MDSSRIMCVWDAPTVGAVEVLEGHEAFVRSLCWSPDGSRLASASDDGTVRVWDAFTGKAVHVLEGHSDWVNSVCWSPDGSRLASASEDKTVRVWDASTGEAVHVLEGHENTVFPVDSVCWSPDGSRLASTSNDDGTVRVWRFTLGLPGICMRLRTREVQRRSTRAHWSTQSAHA